jgi:hypothetical protein
MVSFRPLPELPPPDVESEGFAAGNEGETSNDEECEKFLHAVFVG